MVSPSGIIAIVSEVGEFPEFRIVLNQAGRSFRALAGDHCLEFDGIYSGFALEVVIRDHERGLRPVGYVLDPLFPTIQFAFFVEIVVAVVTIVGVEPLIVVATMKTDIGDRSSHVLGGSERFSQHRLVDVAEGDVLARELGERVGIVSARVAYLDHAWIFDELAEQVLQIFAIERCVLE